MSFEYRWTVRASAGRGEDKAQAWLDRHARAWVVVFDGAGGTGNGAAAAERAFVSVAYFSDLERASVSGHDLEELLEQIDQELVALGGEAAGAVLVLSPGGISGASVGDCEAWVVHSRGHLALTAGQIRKPLLGSGIARPRGFDAPALDATLIAGSDGLFKYARPETIHSLALAPDLEGMSDAIADATKLRDGEHPDDVSVVVARTRP